MSRRYKGAIISATPPTTTGGSSGTAPGEWTLQQQMQAQGGSVWPSQPPPNYIEDVFSTYLYTGTNATQTITNGIDLSTKGGLVWIKGRSVASQNNVFDTARGRGYVLHTNDATSNTAVPAIYDITAFTATGFTLGTDGYGTNSSGQTYASWTFRKQPKFFDVVTYTGTGSNTTIAHSLGSVPGSIWVKRTDAAGAWQVYHRSLANTEYLVLNTTAAKATGATRWNSTTPTSSVFSVGTDATVNASGGTYVAYLFAHDAGGFGLTGADNVISCGSWTGSTATVNLGYEVQWVLVKRTDNASVGDWYIFDIMRGASNTTGLSLQPNTSNAEQDQGGGCVIPTATGFNWTAQAGLGSGNFIYIAIRRGPMAVPTDATKVFSPNSTSGTTGTQITTGFPMDWQILGINAGNVSNQRVSTRLTGVNTDGTSNSQYLITSSTAAEAATGSTTLNWGNTGFQVPSLNSGSPIITWNFRRAPSFFDEVCYTGTGSATTFTHNLGVTPELMIVKRRDSIGNWRVYSANLPSASYFLQLQATSAQASSTDVWNGTAPTSTVFSVGIDATVNASSGTFVNYLFATLAGVSKVGSYSGTGATQTIACGFTGGARFVLVKRTDTTGDWYVWDTARGMVAGTDPSLLLNSTAAEVNANSIYTTTGGFQIVSTAAGINASGGSYIFLAIA